MRHKPGQAASSLLDPVVDNGDLDIDSPAINVKSSSMMRKNSSNHHDGPILHQTSG
eukprot:CAMPEP_0185571332 /NCGR_PEP_ID=MMETSP0434-20130131/3394_1 /TAXON_ID=626734 ORGANISM="Favella taraikaensis, Strain Fe Narragansett Bay" /NCGR_SAMPLE_ID=MMETSP0434 /ASSEMBLY_ACC=CAM_ASM_000379 /LENGTH=55 /DNA_ID=CAMNT_0028186717 /DNA_START=463 /DNA_END=630 /DNA_ORIENTATION=+